MFFVRYIAAHVVGRRAIYPGSNVVFHLLLGGKREGERERGRERERERGREKSVHVDLFFLYLSIFSLSLFLYIRDSSL